MPTNPSSTYVKNNLNQLVRNLGDQVGLVLLDLEAGVDVEILECRFEFIEEFSRSARQVLKTYRGQLENNDRPA
jgi:hypothetical protein